MQRIAFLLAAVSAFSSVVYAQEKTTLDVYYESLCPDSLRFLVNQLGPQYSTLSSFVNVRLIPFGKASFYPKKIAGYNFECQHGPSECKGNMLHACGIEYSTDTKQAVEYAVCLMQGLRNAAKCASSVGLDYKTILSCATGLEGQLLLQLHGVETLSLAPRMTFVPWLVFNGEWSQENQDGGLKNLKATSCKFAAANTAACQ